MPGANWESRLQNESFGLDSLDWDSFSWPGRCPLDGSHETTCYDDLLYKAEKVAAFVARVLEK